MSKNILSEETREEIALVSALTRQIFNETCSIINAQMPQGYAQKNPALVAALVDNQVSLLLHLQTPRVKAETIIP